MPPPQVLDQLAVPQAGVAPVPVGHGCPPFLPKDPAMPGMAALMLWLRPPVTYRFGPPPADRVRDGLNTRMGAEIFEEHRLVLAVGQRDPPVWVLVHRPGHVLRLPLAHRVSERDPDQCGRRAGQIGVQGDHLIGERGMSARREQPLRRQGGTPRRPCRIRLGPFGFHGTGRRPARPGARHARR